MKRVFTILLMASAMTYGLFAQAQLPDKTFGEYQKSKVRSLIHKKERSKLVYDTKMDYKNTRKIISGTTMTPSSVILQTYDDISQEWVNYLRFSIIYENAIYEKEIVLELYIYDEWYPEEKQVNFYNEVWELQETEIYSYFEDKKNWELTGKTISHTDSYGNIILEASLSYDQYSHTWDTLFGVKYNYTYTNFGKPHELLILNYDDWMQQWMLNYKETYGYDAQNRLQELTSYYWEEYFEEFIPESLSEFLYNPFDEWSEILIYSWFFDEWYLELKVGDFAWFDFSQNKPLFCIIYIHTYSPDPWEPISRMTAVYHQELGEITYYLEEYYDGWDQVWIPVYREIVEFDENYIPVLSTIEYYDDGIWWMEMGIRNTYELNAQGFISWNISELYETDYAKSWIYWMKQIFEYESHTGIAISKLPEFGVKAYPNPAKDYVKISPAQNYETLLLEVYNIMGQKVNEAVYHKVEANNPEILDIRSLQPGMYFLHVQAAGKAQMLKIVKQ